MLRIVDRQAKLLEYSAEARGYAVMILVKPVLYQQVAYLMRSGAPDSLDLMVATNYAVMAADLAVDGVSDLLETAELDDESVKLLEEVRRGL